MELGMNIGSYLFDLEIKMNPSCKLPKLLKDHEKFYTTYQEQYIGPPIQFCDVALFLVCTGSHWILFIMDLERMKLLLIDPLWEHELPYCDLRKAYAKEIYVMEKLLPCMLHFLDGSGFFENGFMDVKFIKDRPKQQGSSDCGVYVFKYMDAILGGISLKDARWHPVDDVLTFRYRMTWKFYKGEARRMINAGLEQRNLRL